MQPLHSNNYWIHCSFECLVQYHKLLYSKRDMLKTLLIKPLQLQMEQLIKEPQVLRILYLNADSVDSLFPDMLQQDSNLKSIHDEVKYLEVALFKNSQISKWYRDSLSGRKSWLLKFQRKTLRRNALSNREVGGSRLPPVLNVLVIVMGLFQIE